ncbi:hypothetical protein QAD02_008125 [Eretmocerus hayati]|uniref:Uncharacterized protein n=1 Tax=Eretmocerus hayati TaxID=131215 RepID=A0ACC2N677_9HYME|nr:hypothetical protein QAD02_008125 [Eretmocerus hayati]
MAEPSNAQDLNNPRGDPDAIQEDGDGFRTNNELGSHDNNSFDSIMFEPYLNCEANPNISEPVVPNNDAGDAPNQDATAANPLAHIEILPNFDGKGISVNRFIRECYDIEPFVNPQERASFVRLVKSKVKGNANSYLQYKTFDDLDQLLDELRRTFASSQNLPQAELARVVQVPGERVTDYGLRVTSLLHKINELANEKFGREVARKMVEGSISTAIQCFIMGLNHDLS